MVHDVFPLDVMEMKSLEVLIHKHPPTLAELCRVDVKETVEETISPLFALRSVYEDEPAIGLQNPLKLPQNAIIFRYGKYIEHVFIDDEIEDIVCVGEIAGVGQANVIVAEARFFGSFPGLFCHLRGDVDAFIPTMGIPVKDLNEVQTRTHGHLEHVFPIPYIGNFDSALTGLCFHEEAENVVYMAEHIVFDGDFFLNEAHRYFFPFRDEMEIRT